MIFSSFAPLESPKFAWHHHQTLDTYTIFLIADRHILSSGSCLRVCDDFEITIGSTVKVYANRSYVHPNLNRPVKLANNIGIIELNEPLELSNLVQPICLPSSNEIDNDNAIISGNFFSGDIYGTAFVFEPEACHALIGSYYHESMLCVDFCDCDTNNGDVLALIGENYQQIGIRSWGGNSMCGDGFPVMYTDVFQYIEWISNVTRL